MNSITPWHPKCSVSIMVYKKKHYKDSVIQLYKDFRQQQQKQRAEDDKRLRKELFRNLDYITQETEREKKRKRIPKWRQGSIKDSI